MSSDKCFQRALQYTRNILCKFTYQDFLKLYNNQVAPPLFCALDGKINDYYYEPEESADILSELLHYQFNFTDDGIHTETKVREFLQTLYDILEKKRQKQNSILIISPPTAGKKIFIDCVTAFYLNVGQIANFNKWCQFPLNDAVERRVNIWNEPNFIKS